MSYFVVTGSHNALVALVEAMSKATPTGWVRDRDMEARQAEDGLPPLTCFSCSQTSAHRSARLWLHLTENELREATVTPVNDRRLTRPQWEAVIDAFVAEVLEPSLEGTGLHCERVESNALDTYLTAEPRRRLQTFSSLANKNGANPVDKERWYKFVIAAHRERSDLPPSVLEEWLQAEGWSDEDATDMAIEFEQERTLLKIYDSEK